MQLDFHILRCRSNLKLFLLYYFSIIWQSALYLQQKGISLKAVDLTRIKSVY